MAQLNNVIMCETLYIVKEGLTFPNKKAIKFRILKILPNPGVFKLAALNTS